MFHLPGSEGLVELPEDGQAMLLNILSVNYIVSSYSKSIQIMKRVFRTFVLASLASLCFAGVNRQSPATPVVPIETAQNLPTTGQKILEVALPDSSTVTLTNGESYTGALTDFTPDDLALSVSDFSQIFPLDEIQQVEFAGTVWIVTTDGQRIATRIRGLPIPIEGVPVNALEVVREFNLVKLTLDNVVTDEEFAKLSSESETMRAVTKILFDTTSTMEVTVKSVRR